MVEDVFSKISLVKNNKTTYKSMSTLNVFGNNSLILFHSGLHNEKTQSCYDNYLRYFKDFFLLKTYDNLLEYDVKTIQKMIQDYVMYQRSKGQSHGSISGNLSALKLFYEMNDILGLNWLKLRKMLPEKRKKMGKTPYTTKQIDTLLKTSKNLTYRALINFMSASGVRVGAFEELKIKDVYTPDFDSHGCKAVLVYADTIYEYHTFIHQEAVEALDEYLDGRKTNGEVITPDSWLFCSPFDNSKHYSGNAITSTLSRHVKRALGREQANRARYETMACHGFRKRFVTAMKNNDQVNISLSEKLTGHSVTVPLDDSYHKPLLERLFSEYQKHIPQLVINEKYALKLEIKTLQDKDNEIAILKQTMLEMKYNMLELQNKIKS
ncbi:MAG: site-specific integrase [Nitrosopumilus sp.]|nr:site-specific integrase [Nitrosopumilus sp.]